MVSKMGMPFSAARKPTCSPDAPVISSWSGPTSWAPMPLAVRASRRSSALEVRTRSELWAAAISSASEDCATSRPWSNDDDAVDRLGDLGQDVARDEHSPAFCGQAP